MSENDHGRPGAHGSITIGEGALVATAYTTAYIGVPPHDMMSEEECLRHGGHCFEGTGEVLTSATPQYVQECKHCGRGRVAIPREPFEYRDWPARESGG